MAYEAMDIARREFLKDSLAALGFIALPGGVFAAPAGWKPRKSPNLVFGAVSDTHIRPCSSLGTKGKAIKTVFCGPGDAA